MLYRPVRGITSTYNSVQDAIPAAARVFEVLDAPEVPPDAPDAVAIEEIREGIRYEGVRFGYDREVVLAGVDLELRAGQVVALVGSSGAGKTTIADLLLRFHEPDAGRITIDGTDLRGIRRDSLHALAAIVTQEAFLFDDTIGANIAYGQPDISRDAIVAAARAANIDEFVESLPQGYETPVGELGGQLSGGQRQRLTIARAILRDPQLLIFDEATSALDAKAEREVQGAIANLMRGRTVLLIAHRLSTVKTADMIAVIEDGRVSMTGSHDELLARGGLYRELVEAQLVPGPELDKPGVEAR
jgi:subfamily B ATP-binding cassette protein MsbA